MDGGAQQGLRSGFMEQSVQVSVISIAGLACVKCAQNLVLSQTLVS